MTPELREAIVAAVSEIGGRQIEYAIVLDLDGNEIWTGKGSRTRVGIPREAAFGNVTVHNHPTVATFSGQDMTFAWIMNVAVSVVVDPEYVYIMERPATGWPGALHFINWDRFWDAGHNMHQVYTRLAAMHKFSYCRIRRAPRPGTQYLASSTGQVEKVFG